MADLDLTGLKAPITKRFIPGTGGGTITVDPLQVSEVHVRMESGGTSTFTVNGGGAGGLDTRPRPRGRAGRPPPPPRSRSGTFPTTGPRSASTTPPSSAA